MSSVTALPVESSLQCAEGKLREHLKDTKYTSLGSEYIAFHASQDEVIALAQSDMLNAFRRVILDPVRGLVMLMSPSSGHESISGYLDSLVSSVATLKNISAEQLRATRWRREGDPKNTGNEADCSFYFGNKALGYIEACAQGDDEGDAYTFRVPPDLVVEVALTRESKEKHLSYRDKGAIEFWQLNVRRRKQKRERIINATFLDLQAEAGPSEIDTSLNLPGLTPAHVIRFLRLRSKQSLNVLECYEAVRSLLEDDGGLWIREEAESYASESLQGGR